MTKGEEESLPVVVPERPYPQLIRINERPPEVALAMQKKGGRIGGSRRTKAKKIAGRLRALKRAGITEVGVCRALDILNNKDACDSEIAGMIMKIVEMAETPQEVAIATKLLQDFRKCRHGSEEKRQSKIQMSVDKKGVFTMILENMEE